MKTIFAMLIIFLCIGLFFRSYNVWARLTLIAAVAAVVVYVSIS